MQANINCLGVVDLCWLNGEHIFNDMSNILQSAHQLILSHIISSFYRPWTFAPLPCLIILSFSLATLAALCLWQLKWVVAHYFLGTWIVVMYIYIDVETQETHLYMCTNRTELIILINFLSFSWSWQWHHLHGAKCNIFL